jgi:ATP-dependent Clp protease ATP-binding subunit ClpB
VNFKNTIIIMTSNIGSHIIQERFEELNEGNREEVVAQAKNEVFELLKKTIRPEFLNRIDDVIMFAPLSREEVKQIVAIQFKQIQSMLKENDITLEVSPEAIEWLAELGYDPMFGARPVKRVMQKQVLNELSKQILGGKVTKDSHIILDEFDHQLVFRNAEPQEVK